MCSVNVPPPRPTPTLGPNHPTTISATIVIFLGVSATIVIFLGGSFKLLKQIRDSWFRFETQFIQCKVQVNLPSLVPSEMSGLSSMGLLSPVVSS